MIQKSSSPPAGFSRGAFLFFLMLAPIGIALVIVIVMATQFRQFKSSVSPAADVAEFVWNDSARTQMDTLLSHLHAFTVKERDSLRLEADDLNLLLASSPVAMSQGMRFKVEAQDSLLIVRSTQPVRSMRGPLSGIFRKVGGSGYLNARLEGYPELKDGLLTFVPLNGYLNGQKVPPSALSHRGGMSPADFMEHREDYDAFLKVVAGVRLIHGEILFLHR